MRFFQPRRFGSWAKLLHVTRREDLFGCWVGFGCFCLYLLGNNPSLLILSGTVPIAGLWYFSRFKGDQPDLKFTSGILPKAIFLNKSATMLQTAIENGQKTAVLVVSIDDFSKVSDRLGEAAAKQIQDVTIDRITRGLRDEDLIARTNSGEFTLLLKPVQHLDLEICIQLAARLKTAIERPLPLDATTVQITVSIGFCRNDQLKDIDLDSLLCASHTALVDAIRSGGASIRSYSEKLRISQENQNKLKAEARLALQKGQICAWFQPQVSTETGLVTGFEALARWQHPERGTLAPAEFIETIAESGQLETLADLMLRKSLEAQKSWDAAGFDVPHVGVNFAGDELRNPMLVEKINWELDRYQIAPNRVAIEVLETVIAGPQDGAVSRNVNGLARLGCFIDLDDFGTGHSSISSIRRFSVSRLKIDRSFVMQVDSDPEQKRLVSAIVTMAERLGLETLAEGVETAGEHAALAQLGCSHVQGFGIARPMPFEKTIPWMVQHNARLLPSPQIGRNTR